MVQIDLKHTTVTHGFVLLVFLPPPPMAGIIGMNSLLKIFWEGGVPELGGAWCVVL